MYACVSPNGKTTYEGDKLDVIFAGTIGGIHKFVRAGEGWKKEKVIRPDLHIAALALEPKSGLMFAGAHGGGGLWRSADKGETWERIGKDMPAHVYAIQCQPRNGGVRVWVGVEPASLFFSDDLGNTWTERASLKSVPENENWTFPPPPHIAHVKQVAWHESAPDKIYVLVEQGGLFRSNDAGQTWTELKGYLIGDQEFYRDSHRLIVRPSNPDHLYFATGDGLCRSTDGGETWTYLMTKEGPIGYPDAMFLDPHDDRKIVIGGPSAAPALWRESRNAKGVVLVSADGGDSWTQKTKGLNAPLKGNIEAMACFATPEGAIYLAGTAIGQLFVSDDGCESWRTIAEDLPPVSKAGHYRWFLTDAERAAIEDRMRQWKNA